MNINILDNYKQITALEAKDVIKLATDIQILVDGENAFLVTNVLLSMALNQLARINFPKEKLIPCILESYDEILQHIEKEDD